MSKPRANLIEVSRRMATLAQEVADRVRLGDPAEDRLDELDALVDEAVRLRREAGAELRPEEVEALADAALKVQAATAEATESVARLAVERDDGIRGQKGTRAYGTNPERTPP